MILPYLNLNSLRRLSCAFPDKYVTDNTAEDAAADIAQYKPGNTNTLARRYHECRKTVNIVKIRGLFIKFIKNIVDLNLGADKNECYEEAAKHRK